MIYIASPYSDPDPAVMQSRYEAVRSFAAERLKMKEHVYSPIVHCHLLALHHDLPKDFQFWMDYNLHMIDCSEALYVLMLDGWKTSKGVTAEIKYAEERSLKIIYWGKNDKDNPE